VTQPEVFVCTKKGCGSGSQRRALADEVARVAQVTEVRCQSVCEGPVAGVVVDGRLEWFERLRTPKARRRLRAVLAVGGRGPLPGALAKRRRPKRAGRLKR
jgi:hypothetical protein